MQIDQLHQNKIKLWISISVIFLFIAMIYFFHEKRFPSTDDAYIGANVIDMTAEVSGPIKNIYVKEYQAVKKGDLLFEIDPAPFVAKVEHAKAELDIAKQNVQALGSAVKSAEAVVHAKEAEVKLAEHNHARVTALVKKGQISLQEGDRAINALSVANASLVEAENQLKRVTAELGASDGNNPQIASAEASLKQAILNLNYTRVTSPADGFIVNLTAREGSYVKEGVTLFSVIDASFWWAEANFKETQIERIRNGQKAKIKIDSYPDHIFHGIVQNISRGSGAAFSIFPAENASGNWVKVTQRFAVRILIKDLDQHFPLRVGGSAEVIVDTTG